MDLDALCSQYSRLRADLHTAYGAPIWDSTQIDRLTDQIADTESALATQGGANTFFYAAKPGFGTTIAARF